MGIRSKLSDFLFGKPTKEDDPYYNGVLTQYFQSISGYSPAYTSQDGGLYEIGLCRACVHRKAVETSKATPTLTQHNARYEYMLCFRPNPFMTTSQFMYRLRTIYEMENNAFIVPIEDDYGRTVGIFPVVPSQAEMKEIGGKVYIVYTFGNGDKKSIEYERIGHLRKMQYRNDFFGDGNQAFKPTADLLKAQEKGSADAIKNSSIIRWAGKLNSQVVNDKDFKRQQESLSKLNLNQNDTGLFIYDSRWEKMDPIRLEPVLLDADQKKAIDNSAYSYWGINEEILQNKYDENQWNAFYESELETFFIQCGEVLSNMLYSKDQLMKGNRVLLTSDRLQYASNQSKIAVAKELFDRGILTTNQALEIINMTPIADGDARFIRGEYRPYKGKEVLDDGDRKEKSDSESQSGQSGKED